MRKIFALLIVGALAFTAFGCHHHHHHHHDNPPVINRPATPRPAPRPGYPAPRPVQPSPGPVGVQQPHR